MRKLQAEPSARHSFWDAARILKTFLPCAKQHNTTVRNRLGKVAKDITDAEPPVYETLSAHPLTIFIDGAHIRCRPEYQKRHLDVVVGKIETRDMCRRFDLAPQAANSPALQLRRDLDALGWDDRRPVTVIPDGEAALPNLIRGATKGKVRHILDWWHISMRVQHVQNAIKGLVQRKDFLGTTAIFMTPDRDTKMESLARQTEVAGTHLQWLIVDCVKPANTISRFEIKRRRRRHDAMIFTAISPTTWVRWSITVGDIAKACRSRLPVPKAASTTSATHAWANADA